MPGEGRHAPPEGEGGTCPGHMKALPGTGNRNVGGRREEDVTSLLATMEVFHFSFVFFEGEGGRPYTDSGRW